MPDQSKKASQPKKGTGSKGEATRPVNGKPSGSGGNSSTETTSGEGGRAQATPSQTSSPTAGQHGYHSPNDAPLVFIEVAGHKPRPCPKELSDQIDEHLQELGDDNQPDHKDESKGNGKGKNVKK
ncbi:uncharacterized protein FSUBG_6582 [Fusarium subglutinans]|uniref:Uncharacterized protein n=1 Tax=Gibberella subglutinans TaxID=42677 RepID=A0A8H5PZA5_GIBSU|nr:uncharacterized protein FSUBG_6582 [Fusarium subglutinans]KAF5605197.1 hypothetical protein FSUBG_6582 [Fusarium subglutinans]